LPAPIDDDQAKPSGEQGNSATEVKEKRNGDHNDISSKRINRKKVIWATQAIAHTK
jgi:hypothetical protein